ncbi:hypothetical protein SAMN04487911_13220 [Arenibacter nanhaiticus]|uniref:Uncharacterized protein n=1 Tax=Arenibacter nanhaiticus TaxID=558155 RepID=A0A1M6LL12_9FLAO|nr:hypothetical protein SAMN04487911_13220 [Arenibacter nanhaiticus]
MLKTIFSTPPLSVSSPHKNALSQQTEALGVKVALVLAMV